MEDWEFEGMLERILKRDFSEGTEAFRDSLLARCLAELDIAGHAADLSDDDMGMLAAAGDPHAQATSVGAFPRGSE